MNRRLQALHLARRYPDWDVLASHMGKRGDTLRKELTGVEGYKWGVEDEELLIALCLAAGVKDALAPITAAAVNAGAILLQLPQSLSSEGPTYKCMADAAHEFGVFMATGADAVSDGKITANEMKEVEQKFGRLVATGQAFLTNLHGMHEAAKPQALRQVGSTA